MDTLLINGSHALDEAGRPVTVTGTRALAQRLLVRLRVRKGSFAPDPALGSELWRLPGAAPAERDSLARHWAQEALLAEGARVTGAACRLEGDTLAVALTVDINGEETALEVAIR